MSSSMLSEKGNWSLKLPPVWDALPNLRDLGQRLFDAVFQDEVRSVLVARQTEAKAAGCDLRIRRTRYQGLAKTYFQDVATAAAMNLVRVVNWLWDIPRSQTRKSRFALLVPV